MTNKNEPSTKTVVQTFIRDRHFFAVPVLLAIAGWYFYLATLEPIPSADAAQMTLGTMRFEQVSVGTQCPCFMPELARLDTREVMAFHYPSIPLKQKVRDLIPTLKDQKVVVTWDFETNDHSPGAPKRLLAISMEEKPYLAFHETADQILAGARELIVYGAIMLLVAISYTLTAVNIIRRRLKENLIEEK